MHGGEGWRVHFPNGKHGHVYPSGRQRNHNYNLEWDGQPLRNIEGGSPINIRTGRPEFKTEIPEVPFIMIMPGPPPIMAGQMLFTMIQSYAK
jgi:hypothetical protein